MLQVVVEIPDYYRDFIRNVGNIPPELNLTVTGMLMMGTELPEDHGRIGDLDKVLAWLINKGILDSTTCGEVAKVFEEATILQPTS